MADSRMFQLTDDITIESLGIAIQNWLRSKKELIAEGMKTNQGYLVQAKQEDSWKKLVGMDSAIQIQIFNAGEEQVMINVGSGKWVDKAGAATVGMLVFAPLAVTAAIGAWNQKKLPDELFEFVESYILNGGKSVTISMAASKNIKDNEVVCPNCQAVNSNESKFCSACGTSLQKECPNCHAAVGMETAFCPNCGTNLKPKEEKLTCPDCGNEIKSDSKFCPNCGHSFIEVQENS